eukprot:2089603-Pyramimonas_sp.AAC.1
MGRPPGASNDSGQNCPGAARLPHVSATPSAPALHCALPRGLALSKYAIALASGAEAHLLNRIARQLRRRQSQPHSIERRCRRQQTRHSIEQSRKRATQTRAPIRQDK